MPWSELLAQLLEGHLSTCPFFPPSIAEGSPRAPLGLPAPVQVTPTAPCHPREPNHTPFTGYLCAFAESCSNPGTYFHPSLAFDKVSEKLKSNAAAFVLLRTWSQLKVDIPFALPKYAPSHFTAVWRASPGAQTLRRNNLSLSGFYLLI